MEKPVDKMYEELKKQRDFKDKLYISTKQNLERKIDVISQRLAYYKFEFDLLHGTLSTKIRTTYNLFNSENSRLNDIMKTRDDYLSYEELPVEIKMVLKELGYNE
jgi:hypothetical protein